MYIFDVKWSVTTAGPSPDHNNRVELFLLGCNKAQSGNPCKGCFNRPTWHRPKNARYYDPVFCAENIIQHAPNKYLTIGGGEPLDQIKDLIIMCSALKQAGFHILCYTWRDIFKALRGEYSDIDKQDIKALIDVVDGFIDGEFILEKRCYEEDKEDGLFNSIGSTNQRLVFKTKEQILAYPVYAMKSIYFDLDNKMHVVGQFIKFNDNGRE